MKKRQPNCVVTIGDDCYILPMADGLKLVDIMAKASQIERNYSGRKRWIVGGQPKPCEVGLELLREEDVEFRQAAPVRLALPGASS